MQSVTEANVAMTIAAASFKDLPAEVTQQFATQLKSQKSYAAVVVGTDLTKLILG